MLVDTASAEQNPLGPGYKTSRFDLNTCFVCNWSAGNVSRPAALLCVTTSVHLLHVLQLRLYGSSLNRVNGTSRYRSKQMNRAMVQIQCLKEDLENNLFLLLFSVWKTITHPNYSLCAESAAGSVPALARSDTFIPSCFLPPLWS